MNFKRQKPHTEKDKDRWSAPKHLKMGDIPDEVKIRGRHRKSKVCKKTKGAHEFAKYVSSWASSRNAVCFCGKHLWMEFLCKECGEWVGKEKRDAHGWFMARCPNKISAG